MEIMKSATYISCCKLHWNQARWICLLKWITQVIVEVKWPLRYTIHVIILLWGRKGMHYLSGINGFVALVYENYWRARRFSLNTVIEVSVALVYKKTISIRHDLMDCRRHQIPQNLMMSTVDSVLSNKTNKVGTIKWCIELLIRMESREKSSQWQLYLNWEFLMLSRHLKFFPSV